MLRLSKLVVEESQSKQLFIIEQFLCTHKHQVFDGFLQAQIFLFIFEALLLQIIKVIVRHNDYSRSKISKNASDHQHRIFYISCFDSFDIELA